MKKATLSTIYSALLDAGYESTDPIMTELSAELNKGAERAQANQELYAAAHEVVIGVLATASAPVTLSELYEAVEADLPEGMTKGKVQYAVTRLWVDEIAKVEGKVNSYTLKA